VLRVIADTAGGAGWLRWTTPLGWAEELRPFAGARPVVLLLPAFVTAVTLTVSARIANRRDIGTGLLAVRDTARPRLKLLSSPLAQGFRLELGSLAGWLVAVGAFAVVLGVISKSISSAGIPKSAERTLEQLGAGSVLTPRGYLGFSFVFFVLAISMFACTQIAAARHEEAGGRLETLLSLPVSRRAWLGGRLLIAAGSATAIALTAGALSWVGAASAGVSLSLWRMLEAGANCLPVATLFLGLAALLYAAFPRPGPGIAYALVSAAFVWQLFGSVLGAPTWLLDLSPFRHVGLVPAQSFRAGPAAIMVAIGAAGSLAALAVFARRDLSAA
jgi:ABC-2 type transport system permease protein